MMRTFRMVAEPGGVDTAWVAAQDAPAIKALVCIDIVLRGELVDVDAVAPIVRAWLDSGVNLLGSWVDEGTDRASVTFSVAP